MVASMTLNGKQKAATVLLSVDAETAAKIMKNFKEEELAAIAFEMNNLGKIAPGAEAQAFAVEVVGTFFLCLTIATRQNAARLSTDDVYQRARLGGPPQSGEITRWLVAGFALNVLVFCGAQNVSGIGLSPYRIIAPMIVLNFYPSSMWVHIVAPIVGFLLAVPTGLFFEMQPLA